MLAERSHSASHFLPPDSRRVRHLSSLPTAYALLHVTHALICQKMISQDGFSTQPAPV